MVSKRQESSLLRTWPMLGYVGAGSGVLSLHEAERARLGVVAARLELHLAAEVLVQALLPALRSSAPDGDAWRPTYVIVHARDAQQHALAEQKDGTRHESLQSRLAHTVQAVQGPYVNLTRPASTFSFDVDWEH